MSLSSFLLPKAQDVQAVDSELDNLFKSKVHTAPLRADVKAQNVTSKKRKLESEAKESSTGVAGKKAKKETQTVLTKTNEEEDTRSADESESDESESEQGSSSENEEDGRASSDDEDDSFDPSKIVHESLLKPKEKSRKASSKKKYVPPDETSEQRDLRTIFVGNLSVEVVKKRPLQKQLRRHLLCAVPTAKIESIRFRSVPFKDPAVDLTTTGDETSSSNKHHGKDGREHDKTRAATWRHSQADKDTNENKDEKRFLTPNQKKKIAFIHQEFHSVADTVHAYVVFAHPASVLPSLPSSSTTPEPKLRKEVLDPYEAAQIAARQCDGTTFMDRLLRVDVVSKSSTGDPDANPKLTIFVGNLDFASKEEDLRVFFEGVVSKERGEAPPKSEDEEDEGDEEGGKDRSVKKERAWVTRVRIVRDRETQLGKGFAYVQFADRECVDEILALEAVKLKFAKRKLRVQRCKTIPGSSLPTKQLTAETHKTNKAKAQSQSKSKSQPTQQTTKANKQSQPVQPPKPIIVPKGNPKLGDKLAHLSKDERKRAKAADADRVARRLAKKKARMAMGTTKDNDQASGDGKKRVRVRKSAKSEPKKKKGRMRSEASVAKLNAKK